MQSDSEDRDLRCERISRAQAEAVFHLIFGMEWSVYLSKFEGVFGTIPNKNRGWASCTIHFEQNVRMYFGRNYRESSPAKYAQAKTGYEWVSCQEHRTAVLHTGSLMFFAVPGT